MVRQRCFYDRQPVGTNLSGLLRCRGHLRQHSGEDERSRFLVGFDLQAAQLLLALSSFQGQIGMVTGEPRGDLSLLELTLSLVAIRTFGFGEFLEPAQGPFRLVSGALGGLTVVLREG